MNRSEGRGEITSRIHEIYRVQILSHQTALSPYRYPFMYIHIIEAAI